MEDGAGARLRGALYLCLRLPPEHAPRPLRCAGPLLRWAKAVVPKRRWAATPVFLCATAGLRKLPEAQQEALLAGVQGALRRSPFRCAAGAQLARLCTACLAGWCSGWCGGSERRRSSLWLEPHSATH